MASNKPRFDRRSHFCVGFPAEDSALAVHIVHRRGLPPAFEPWL